ncbi:MAG: molybdopterin molybdenumtransferase MoeA, partial [Chloroflexi bacterium]|nr:molybdopterin molybdenumtransferase MoeA [Chloroflexota bacterium]
MISVDEALERVMAHINPLPAETKPLLDAQGQTLAEDIVAAFALPPWDNS